MAFKSKFIDNQSLKSEIIKSSASKAGRTNYLNQVDIN